jgi:hypothetical protein
MKHSSKYVEILETHEVVTRQEFYKRVEQNYKIKGQSISVKEVKRRRKEAVI